MGTTDGWEPQTGEGVMIRRYWATGRLDHEYQAVVGERTPKFAFAAGRKFRRVGDEWHLTPRYSDYLVRLERLERLGVSA